MKQNGLPDVLGLRLSRQALRVLKERGIFAHSPVSLEHQHLAKRYVVRGLESGGAVGDLGRYITFAQEDGQPMEYLHPVEAIGVNGLHAVVVAPVARTSRDAALGKDLRATHHATSFGHRQRWQAPSPGDEGRVSRNSWSAGLGSVRQRQKPSWCCIADVLLACRRRSNHPKTISRGGSCHHKGSELRWMFALSFFQSAQGRTSHGIVVCRRRGMKGVETTCKEG